MTQEVKNQIDKLKSQLSNASVPESLKSVIRKKLEALEASAETEKKEESDVKKEEKLEKEAEGNLSDAIAKMQAQLDNPSVPESLKSVIRKKLEKAKSEVKEAKEERAEEKKEAEKKEAEVKAKVKEAVEKVKKVVKEAPKKVSAEKTPAKAKAAEKKVEKEVKKELEKAKTEVKKAKVEAKKVEAKKAEGAKKRKKKFGKMLSDLQRLINKDKKLKALYGAENPSDLKRDAGRMAKPFGWRYKGEHNYKVPPKSERGNKNTYYEGRPEKADLRRRTYPYLEMGGMMARGGELSEIKMYYHETSGGAEYLCSEKVEGTKGEGSFKSKYVVRLDGATDGSKMIIKDNDKVKTIKMYYHETSGGAEYLCSEKVEGTKGEGSFKSKYVVRLDGATDGSKMIIKSGKYEHGGMMEMGVFKVMGWKTEEDREMGDSETLGKFDSLEAAKKIADNAFYRQNYASIEILEGDDVVYFLGNENEEYKLGGMFGKSRYNTGRSWHLDHARHNKKEDYEKPINERKGAKKSSSTAKRAKTSKYSKAIKSVSKSASTTSKRAKTGKFAKASRAESSRGYNYLPNNQIKSITTVDGKVITKKKILDGAYVRKKNGGMM